MCAESLNHKKAQTVVEFTITMVVCCVILYFMVVLFRWGMVDLADRRYNHDVLLNDSTLSTNAQVNPNFHHAQSMEFLLAN